MRDAAMDGSVIEARALVLRERSQVASRLPVRTCLGLIGGLSVGMWWVLWLAVQAVL